MTIELRRATRQKAKLRIGLSGPSGSGKTYSALKLAYGLVGDWSKVALIDTENGSGDLYSHIGNYYVHTLEAPYTPERYIEVLNAFVEAGMEAIIIDSASHEWTGEGGLLESNEKLAIAKYKGNTWSAWNETTPRHNRFIEKVLTAPAHVILTARSKTDTIMTEDKRVKKVGMKDMQRDGFEYEMTVKFDIDRDSHMALVSKDRTELFEGGEPFMIVEETGKKLREWANRGVELPKKPTKAELVEEAMRAATQAGKIPTEKTRKYLEEQNSEKIKELIREWEKETV